MISQYIVNFLVTYLIALTIEYVLFSLIAKKSKNKDEKILAVSFINGVVKKHIIMTSIALLVFTLIGLISGARLGGVVLALPADGFSYQPMPTMNIRYTILPVILMISVVIVTLFVEIYSIVKWANNNQNKIAKKLLILQLVIIFGLTACFIIQFFWEHRSSLCTGWAANSITCLKNGLVF